MPVSILATKLYAPPPRLKQVLRPRLVERLNEGMGRRLTLVSAPAGFGKTTLVSEWIAGCKRPVAWFSVDEGDSDPRRFLTYFVSALQTVSPDIGRGALGALQSTQPPPTTSILTILLNEIAAIQGDFTLVLDDYHAIDAKPVDDVLAFLVDHLPPQMHLIIATREDPRLPLARLRVHSELTELRASDLCFTPTETADFVNRVMGLGLSAEDIAALDARAEGWIAGLQLAAISMQGHQDATSFIKSFSGSHHFVVDYLVEEVLQQQPKSVQTFLLRTSILDRLCGPLCDAVLLDQSADGQKTLEYLQQANLFIVPLDDERRWYRYHHLFADLLRQRLGHSAEYHIRASQWYEDSGLELEAFRHASAANDIDRTARLVEGKGTPLHFRGGLVPVLNWLKSLPAAVLDARPSLWVMYASALSISGQLNEVEPKLQAAEAVLQGAEPNEKTRNLVGHIAGIRALLAAFQGQVKTIIAQAHLALEYLSPDNLAARASAAFNLGWAYQRQGERVAARRAYTEAISISQASANSIVAMLATTGLGSLQAADNQLNLAAETYRRALSVIGDQPIVAACEAYLGLARVFYEWNDLDEAERYGRQGVRLAGQIDNAILAAGNVLLARLKLARGDTAGASAILVEASQSVRQHGDVRRIHEVIAAQVVTLLSQGNLEAAAHLAQTHDLPLSQARVLLAQGNTSAALTVLESFRLQVEAKGWEDERLKAMILQAVALQAQGKPGKAERLLRDALLIAEPGGFIRIFVDEGMAMARLLSGVAARGIKTDYTVRLLAAIEVEKQKSEDGASPSTAQALIESLSQRELEVLQLIAKGLSNHEISERLFLALDTVKGHNRRIYDKLQVQRRTEAVARARELGLLSV